MGVPTIDPPPTFSTALKDSLAVLHDAHCDQILGRRFQDLMWTVLDESRYSTAAALRQENISLNRYTDILPFEHNRIILRDNGNSTYINASYIQFDDQSPPYIATQGPLENTAGQFWRMVIQENVQIIVMLTKLIESDRVKCHRYWPYVYTKERYGSVVVESLQERVHPTYVESQLSIHFNGERRNITHLYYTDWPDHGVPRDPDSFLSFLYSINAIWKSTPNYPIIVHCSAGCGRTGTLCTIDTALKLQATDRNYMAIEKTDPITAIIRTFRDQRVLMVQTPEQYKFCYQAVLLHLTKESA